MSTIAAQVPPVAEAGRELLDVLRPLHGEGVFAPSFDGPSTGTLDDRRLTAMSLCTPVTEIAMGLILCFLQAVALHIRNPLTWSRRKVLIVDDAWAFLSSPPLGRLLRGLMRVGAHTNLAVGCCTTSFDDFTGAGPDGAAILKNAPYRFLFVQSQKERQRAKTSRQVTVQEFALLESLDIEPGAFMEFVFFNREHADPSILRIPYDARFRWVATGVAVAVEMRRGAERHHRDSGADPVQALLGAIEDCHRSPLKMP